MSRQSFTVQVGGRPTEIDGSLSDALAFARERDGFLWLDLTIADSELLHQVIDELHQPVERVRRQLHGSLRSLMERRGDTALVVLQPARYLEETESVELADLSLLIGPNHLVTISAADWVNVAEVRQRVEHHSAVLAHGPYAVAAAFCEFVLAGYRPVLAGVENDIDEIEDELFAEANKRIDRRIFDLQRTVVTLQHATAPLSGVITHLHDADPVATTSQSTAALSATAEHVADRVEGFRRTLETALNIHATMVNQRLTELGLTSSDNSKKISSWAAILFAPSVISGIYGMNFTHMPELQYRYAYPIALLAMVVLAVTLFVIFKRKNWL